MNKILLLLLLLVSITQSESVERGVGIAAETNPTAQHLVLTDVLTYSVAPSRRDWTKQEDTRLLELVNKYGSKWAMIAIMIPGKTRKQCRQRWTTVVMPGINKAPWTTEEDEILLSLYEEMGPRWSLISPRIPGRTGNQCWNRCNLLKKSLNKKAELNKQRADANANISQQQPQQSLNFLNRNISQQQPQQSLNFLNHNISQQQPQQSLNFLNRNISQQQPQQSLNFLTPNISQQQPQQSLNFLTPNISQQPQQSLNFLTPNISQQLQQQKEQQEPKFHPLNFLATTSINTPAERATTAEVPTPQPLDPQPISNSRATAATTAATAELSYDAFHIVGEQEAPLALVSIDQLLNCKISINTHIAPAVTAEPSYDAFHIGGDDLDPFACMSEEEQGDSYGY